jgi:hypothetical protein
MQCEEFEHRLNAVLDERLLPEWEAELRLHCETCHECREVAAAYGAVLDGFYALSTPKAPTDMAQRVLADLRPRPAPARRVSLVALALATAAGLLIALAPLARFAPRASAPSVSPQVRAQASPRPAPGPVASVAARDPAADAAILKTAHAAKLPLPTIMTLPNILPLPVMWPMLASVYQADPYSNLAKETGLGLAALVLYVPGIGGTKGIIDVADNTVENEPNWASQMSEGLKPVSQSVSETFNLLWRTLPLSDLAGRS